MLFLIENLNKSSFNNAFFFFLRPTFICPLVSSKSFPLNQNDQTLTKASKSIIIYTYLILKLKDHRCIF
jgi:hypothetical protein